MRGRRRTRIVARVADETATVSVDVVQPAVARRPAAAGHPGPPTREARPLRLRAPLLRHRRERARPPISRRSIRRAEEIAAATVRRVVDAALPLAVQVPDPLPAELREREGLALKRDALAAVHRPRDRRRGRDRPAAACVRGAARPPGRHRAARGRAGADARSRARRAGRPDPPLPLGAAVRAHAVPGAGDPRARRRPRAHRPDATAPAGRRRLGQDGRRALRAAPRRGERAPGGAHGAD